MSEPAPPANLQTLFNMQDLLIEHKFPADHIAEHEYQLSNAGDVFRSMTESSPDYGYIGAKVESISKYLKADNSGDFREYKALMAMPDYKQKRDKYMWNLAELKNLTRDARIDLKRKDVMLDALDLARGIVLWFESLDPYRPPRYALEKLTGSLERFFPAQFREEPSNPSNPGRELTEEEKKEATPSDAVIPYLVVPVAFAAALAILTFAGWVASQLVSSSLEQ